MSRIGKKPITVPAGVEVKVEDANLDAYQNLSDSGEVELLQDEEIEGGVIKEFAKTLLVGGLVRLTSKLLRPKK